MINANLEQFLDTGWFNEATLYYNGYTYWCEGYWDIHKDNHMHFFVYKFPSIIVEERYFKRIEDGKIGEYEYVFDTWGMNEEAVKEQFLKAKIFDGKSFWEVESELAWYEEY